MPAAVTSTHTSAPAAASAPTATVAAVSVDANVIVATVVDPTFTSAVVVDDPAVRNVARARVTVTAAGVGHRSDDETLIGPDRLNTTSPVDRDGPTSVERVASRGVRR